MQGAARGRQVMVSRLSEQAVLYGEASEASAQGVGGANERRWADDSEAGTVRHRQVRCMKTVQVLSLNTYRLLLPAQMHILSFKHPSIAQTSCA
jgi:hypothetical protein